MAIQKWQSLAEGSRFGKDYTMSWLFEKYPLSCILDFKPRFFLGWFLYKLFGKVQIDEHARAWLREKQRQGTVVYVTKYPGRLDYLLYHYRLRKSRLPYPRIGLDLNMSLFFPISFLFKMVKFQFSYIFKYHKRPNPYQLGLLREGFQKGVPALLCLLDPKRFRRQFVEEGKDPITYLIEIQQDMERPIFLVPSLILYRQAPERDPKGLLSILFGYKDNPGPLRKIFLFFRHNRRAFFDFGPPIDLREYLASPEYTNQTPEALVPFIREQLIQAIDSQKKAIIGPLMKSRQELKEQVLNDKEVLRTIERLSSGKAGRQRQLKAKASEYFDEIAADYSPTYVVLTYSLLTRFWKRLFQGIEIDPDELALVRNWARKGPVIFVPSHKSHIDYLVLNYTLYEYYVQVPKIAAGQNLAFWPVGHIFRKCGAFFIRRSFSGARLYTKVFSAYVNQLLQEGYFIEFFIEGGRSRSGKLVLPKTGFLSILLDAYLNGHCNDLIFVPASIAYDRIIEEKSYVREQEGVAKEREGFWQILKARKLLKKKYGKIYIRFAQPFSIRDYLGPQQSKTDTMEETLALDLVRAINHVTPITPLALVSSVILSKFRKHFELKDLYASVEELALFLEAQKAPMVSSLSNLMEAFQETLHLLSSWKIISPAGDLQGDSSLYTVNPKKHRELDYYKNSIIHYFLDHTLVALSLLSGKEAQKDFMTIQDDYIFLRELFKNEFIFEGNTDDASHLEEILSYFRSRGLVEEGSGSHTYKVTRKGYHNLPLWAGLARSFLESYWIATRVVLDSFGQKRKKAELLKKMNSLGTKLHETGFVKHYEAVSYITFQNAFQYLNENYLRPRGDKEINEEEVRDQLEKLADQIYTLSHYTSVPTE
ncbi:MAG: hypothetical protein DRG76_00660 [Deltaproteobacteria bacterium]|nr:MAG: hypothetical protein DRG76_00660 [Deltaproteobacteria bacterium]